MSHDDEDSVSDIVERPTPDELRAAAEIVVYLEYEMGIDVRRIRVRVSDGVVHLQGSVATQAERREIEESLPGRFPMRELANYLTIRHDDREHD